MARMKKLSSEELEAMKMRRQPSPRTIARRKAIEEFKAFLQDLAPGEGGEILLEPDENRLTVKNRLKKAAKELGIEIEFIRKRGRIVFRVVKKNEPTQS